MKVNRYKLAEKISFEIDPVCNSIVRGEIIRAGLRFAERFFHTHIKEYLLKTKGLYMSVGQIARATVDDQTGNDLFTELAGDKLQYILTILHDVENCDSEEEYLEIISRINNN